MYSWQKNKSKAVTRRYKSRFLIQKLKTKKNIRHIKQTKRMIKIANEAKYNKKKEFMNRNSIMIMVLLTKFKLDKWPQSCRL